jgi:galactokinase
MAGTACGGMDQTASIMGSKNNALLIDFKPQLGASLVKIPDQVSFVITNTCVKVEKV